MKLKEVIERLQAIYDKWGNVGVCMEVPNGSSSNSPGLFWYEIYDIRRERSLDSHKIVMLAAEKEWRWRGKDNEAPLDAPD